MSNVGVLPGDLVFSDSEGIKFDTPFSQGSGYPVYPRLSGINAGGGRGLFAVSPDGARACGAASTSQPVQFYDLAGVVARIDTNSAYTSSPRALVWSPSGARVAVPSSGTPFICEFETATYTKLSALPATAGSAWCAAYSPDESLLAVGHQTTPLLTVYDLASGTALPSPPELPASTVGGVVFSPDGATLYVTHNGTQPVYAYDTTTWARTELPGGAQSGSGKTLVISPDGSKLASLGNTAAPALRVYDLAGPSVFNAPAGYPTSAISKGRWLTNTLLLIQRADGLGLVDYATATPQWLGLLNLGGSVNDWDVMPGGARRYFAGTVVDGGDAPAERPIRILDRGTGRIVATTRSDPVTGEFQATVLNGRSAIVYALGGPGEQSKFRDSVTPVASLDPPTEDTD